MTFFISFLYFQLGFGQVFMNTDENISLSEYFTLAEDKSNEILETSYPNLGRPQRLDIKKTILQGSQLTYYLNRSGRVIFLGEAVDYLNDLKSKILAKYPVADSSIRVLITDDVSLNAFATVDNRIYVNVGLLARVETEGQLVFVLCHEIMHIINRHIIGISETENETSISKDKILQNKEIQMLDRHLQSQKDEFEADLDGYGLFSQLDYHPSEALNSIALLSTATDPIQPFEMKASSLFMETESYEEIYESFIHERMINKNTKRTSKEESKHPAIADRWEILDSIILDKTFDGEFAQSDIFLKIKQEASKRISSILAKDLDFIGLFQDASSRYFDGNHSDETYKSLGYSLQGMFIDKLKELDSKSRFSPNKSDSLINHFYKKSSKNELACWAYLTLTKLQSEKPEVIDPFLQSLRLNMAHLDSADYRDIVGVKPEMTKTTKAPNELSFEDIEFTVSPFVDLTPKQFKLHKRREGQGNYEGGKIALLNTSAFKIRKEGMFSMSYSLDTRKGQVLANRSHEAFEGLEENREEIVCLAPSSDAYFAKDYKSYQTINTWLNEYTYFDKFEYQSYLEDELNILKESEDIRYAFSSLSVEVKGGSAKQFLLTYFSPFILPLYVPMLVVNTIIDGTRNYTLCIIIDLETKSLVLWDKRTSNEPSTTAFYYQNYDDVINKFMTSKKNKSL